MKKMFLSVTVVMAMAILPGCNTPVDNTNNAPVGEVKTEEVAEVAVDVQTSVPFADIGDDIMDAKKNYSLFKFTEPEGTCMEMGFPENLVYKSTNMIMSEDEKYFDQGTSVDFTGMIRFRDVPLTDGNAKCSIKTTKGINTANLSCKITEGDKETEVCTGSFKVIAEK